MPYGICNLNSIALRLIPEDNAEMVSQILFGEVFEVIETNKNWLKVKLSFDDYEGWIDKKQQIELSEDNYLKLNTSTKYFVSDLVNIVNNSNNELYTITLGAELPFFKNNRTNLENFEFQYDGSVLYGILAKSNLVNNAYLFLNAPYLWGGKTPLGIDCSGFTQMVYKLNGYKLFRDASQQATQGVPLSFIEESVPGDLAFFDDEEGKIIHVGIILANHQIIHAHGKVRIDQLDHSGIYNVDTKRHTHKLRVIKKII